MKKILAELKDQGEGNLAKKLESKLVKSEASKFSKMSKKEIEDFLEKENIDSSGLVDEIENNIDQEIRSLFGGTKLKRTDREFLAQFIKKDLLRIMAVGNGIKIVEKRK
jgi:hypothetical protein